MKKEARGGDLFLFSGEDISFAYDAIVASAKADDPKKAKEKTTELKIRPDEARVIALTSAIGIARALQKVINGDIVLERSKVVDGRAVVENNDEIIEKAQEMFSWLASAISEADSRRLNGSPSKFRKNS